MKKYICLYDLSPKLKMPSLNHMEKNHAYDGGIYALSVHLNVHT